MLGLDAAGGGIAKAELPESVEDDLVLLGLVGMIDPPRSEAKAAVATAKRAHIRTVMITGDHPATAEAIARELTIFEPGTRSVTGAELRAMGDAEFDAVVEEVRVFARVDPEHKLRIIKALQRKGHIVAMTGDGINDAPALKSRQYRRRHGHHRHGRLQGGGPHRADRRQLRQHREGDRGRARDLRQHPKYLIYLLSTNSGELLTMFGA